MIKEVKKQAPPPPKRSHPLLRALALILTVLLVLGAIALVVNRDRLNFDTLKRWYTYRNLAKSDSGGGEPFSYQGGNDLTLCLCGGDLLAVSQSGARLYSPGGTAYIDDTFTMKAPVCQVSGNAAVVYDAAGSALRVYRDRVQVFSLDDAETTILSARLNQNAQLAVVTRSSGYKGVVSVYRSDYTPLMDLQLSSAYVLDAVVAPDGRSVLVLTAGQENRFFSSALAQYSLSDLDPQDPRPTATWSLGNRLPLDLVWDDQGGRVMAEYAALSADSAMTQTGEYGWPDRYLKRYSLLADDVTVVLTGKYRSGSQTALEVLDRSGQMTASLEETRPILSMSAAGRYIGLLTSQELNIYTRDLSLYATLPNDQDATHLVMLPDGCAYLATQDTAWLCLPNR